MHFIHCIENSLSKEACENIIDIFNTNESQAAPGGQGTGGTVDDLELNLLIKNNDDFWGLGTALLDGIEEYKKLFPLIDTDLYRWNIDPSCQLMRYEPGKYYSTVHCENNGNPVYASRVFAWMFYLNTINEGGGTHFVHQGFTTTPQAGSLYIWPAVWTHMHCGVPAPNERKYIITGWCSHTK